jgi:hypothetical protein
MELTDDQQQLLERIRAHLREEPERMLRKQALNAEHAEAEAALVQLLGPIEPPRRLPRPVTPEQLAAAEAELGLRLPVFLGALYTHIADGGFGPGKGLWPLETLLDEYDTLRVWQRELADERLATPGLLPITALSPVVEVVLDCTDPAGPVYHYDLHVDGSWRGPRRLIAPSLEAWCVRWLEGAFDEIG